MRVFWRKIEQLEKTGDGIKCDGLFESQNQMACQVQNFGAGALARAVTRRLNRILDESVNSKLPIYRNMSSVSIKNGGSCRSWGGPSPKKHV